MMELQQLLPALIAVHSDDAGEAHLFHPLGLWSLCGEPFGKGGAAEDSLRHCCMDCVSHAIEAGLMEDLPIAS